MKILIVDDSKAMRMIVKRTLRQAGFGDHTISEANDGQEGLEAIHADCPDLVMCDWNMPNMTGLQLLQAINEEGIELCFGFVTSEGTAEMRSLASENGAKFLITKPFTADDFSACLGEVIS